MRRWTIAAAVVGGVLVAAAIPRFHHALTTTVPWDLLVDQHLARALWSGFNPYTEEGVRRASLEAMGPAGGGHPPTTALWALPFIGLGLRAAAVALGVVTLLALLGAITVTMTALGAPGPLALAWVVFGYVVFCPFMTYHLAVGQLSGMIAALFIVAWWAARQGRDLLAGIALGAACTIKLFPGLVVLIFLVLRRWRLAAAALGVHLAATLAVTARFGWSAWPLFLARQRAVAEEWLGSIQNQSLHGVVLRFFRPACGPPGGPLPLATALSVTLALALIAGAVLIARRAGSHRFDLVYAFFVVLSILASQWAWEHYDVILVLPAILAAAALVRARSSRRLVLGGAAVLLALAGSWQFGATERVALQAAVRRGTAAPGTHVLMHVYEVVNWAPTLALLLLLAVLLRPPEPRSAAQPAY
jgi:alpha-1,2-mannosyltransferase